MPLKGKKKKEKTNKFKKASEASSSLNSSYWHVIRCQVIMLINVLSDLRRNEASNVLGRRPLKQPL